MVRALEKELGVKAVSMTSYTMPSLTVHLSRELVERLKGDPRITGIWPMHKNTMQFSTWENRQDGPETVSWGKIAIGTDDVGPTSGTVIYLIDGAALIDGTMDPHLENPIIRRAPVLGAYFNIGAGRLAPGHANHVAGILSAASNSYGMRGVNPGAPIVNVARGEFPYELAEAFDWVLADAEQLGIYGVANFSSTWRRDSPSLTEDAAYQNRFIRRVSNRVLLVQAAGNDAGNACPIVYDRPNPDDGILVVGGIDENGQRAMPFDNTAVTGRYELGTTYGSCIEAWGPAMRIPSTWNDGGFRILSGTSMAAPHITALAARYGNTSTTPVEREKYIRAKLFNTGHNDAVGNPIRVPSYLQPPAFPIPGRIQVAYVNAYSGTGTAEGGYPSNVHDSAYLSGNWNAGGNTGYIEMNLGSSRTLTGIRLVPNTWPEQGQAMHWIYAGSSANPEETGTLVAFISGYSAILEPISAALGNVTATYVRVKSSSNDSWVSWREIEFYGY